MDAPAIPCGLVAKSWFNDTFELWKKGSPDTIIPIIEDNIAWTSDITYKFANTKDVPATAGAGWEDVQWHSMTD